MAKRIKKRKLEIVFDDKKRREFLTGFRKRKQERRKKAREELDIQVKEERKKIKQEIKEGFRDQLKKSFEPIPELENELNEEEFETEEVSVKITELSTSDLAKSNNWIGLNRPIYSDDEKHDESETEAVPNSAEEIPGMGLTSKKELSTKKSAKTNIQKDVKGKDKIEEDPAKLGNIIKPKKEVSKDALRTLKNSKAFQIKQKLDQLKDRKKARIEREKRIKVQTKEAKKNGGRVNQRKIKKKMKLRRKGKR